MALETNIIEFPFTQGQNEGVQRDVLPLGQFSYLQNVRYRRGNRLGKRTGYDALTTSNLDGATIGGTPTLVTTLGDQYVAVDDRFYLYDSNGEAWGDSEIQLNTGSYGGKILTDRWPQFMPGPAFAPLHQLNEIDLYTGGGTALNTTASMAYCQSLLWICWCYRRHSASGSGEWQIRVHAIDPATGLTVFRQELRPIGGGGAVTDPQQPHLVATTSGTLALVYDHFTAGVKDGIRIRLLTSRATGFGATEYTVACTESAVNAYVGDFNHILITYADGTNNTNTGSWNVDTQVFDTLTTTATGADGVPALLSVFGVSGGNTWVGFSGTGSGATKVRAYTSALAVAGTSGAMTVAFAAATAPTPPVLFALRPATPTVVTAVMHSATAGTAAIDITSTGAFGGNPMLFHAVRPVSWPFNVGNETYVWVRHSADAQVGVATLVRVPLASEYANNISPYTKALPIEATLDDEDIDDPVAIGVSGPTYPTPIAAGALGHVACLTPTVSTIVGPGPVTYKITQPLVVPVRHVSEDLDYRQAGAVRVLGKTFVPSAQPMFIESTGAVEAGFIQAPSGATINGTAGGGALTAGATYQYCATFDYEDANGRLERSAPCLPVSVAMGANTQVTLSVNALELSKKRVRCNVYRTRANQSTFFLLTTLEGSPTLNWQNAGTNYFTVVDTAADNIVGSNEQLYVQVGQELADSQFPACQFATVGGERLWVGGGFKANVIQASKPFLPRMSVAFADDDAFRVMLPEACTGIAWLDNLVAFTEEGIYVVTGDGPDIAGVGSFALSRLPFSIGCNNWRSVIATDEGVFFQSERGLCLLPRGFAEPIHIEQVVSTLASYPNITSAAAIRTESTSNLLPERTVQWVCVNAAGSASRLIVYDTIRKLWGVDVLGGSAPVLITSWNGQRALGCDQLTSRTHPLRLESGEFRDHGTAIEMIARTGDIRPWGTFAHGVINRLGIIHELRAASTLNVALTTEHGARTVPRVYTGIAPDPVSGATTYLEIALGQQTLRDVNTLRVEISESSTNEGVALIGMVVEHDVKPQGFKALASRDRVT